MFLRPSGVDAWQKKYEASRFSLENALRASLGTVKSGKASL
jgi:hypothetical protein